MPVTDDDKLKRSDSLRSGGHRILVVEDEADLLDAITFALKREGLKPIRASSGEEALERAAETPPDLVLLDLMLPGIDGIEVCRRLRANERTARVPIIMVTVKAEETDAIVGLGVGADDYVRKPFGLKELVARVRAVLRRAEEPQDSEPRVLVAGELEVDPGRHETRISGRPVTLTATEFRLLYHLVRNRGRVYSRAQLLDKCVGNEVIVVERNVDVHISALRRKLGELGLQIETIRGVGYKFSERV